MKIYLDLLKDVLENGEKREDRTGTADVPRRRYDSRRHRIRIETDAGHAVERCDVGRGRGVVRRRFDLLQYR